MREDQAVTVDATFTDRIRIGTAGTTVAEPGPKGDDFLAEIFDLGRRLDPGRWSKS
jgi:hypothetical protein